MKTFSTGQTVARRDVHRSGRVWSEHALRVIADSGEALMTACAPGAQAQSASRKKSRTAQYGHGWKAVDRLDAGQ
ncbi:hypothetical protein [Streptomyces sp. NRRL S-31]|uniref:hypothetical protein n=1 Tax=Streptomyces sp. NRRL S-31 TaxID=1463898 RepID=UPI00069C1857|nr:hypothetical protein [Streptomyces sp. NRRL S-31]